MFNYMSNNLLQIIIGFLKSLIGLNKKPIDNTKVDNDEIEQQRFKEESLSILTNSTANNSDSETSSRVNSANATRLKHSLDKAVSLIYYQKGYESSKYPDIVRTYEFGQITKEEYEQRKKENPKSVNLVTYCNVLARKIGRGCFDYGLYDNRRDPEYSWLNWNLSEGFPFGQDYNKIFYGIPPASARQYALQAASEGKIKMLSCEEAQLRANIGIYIWGVGDGHEVVVYPDLNNSYRYDPVKGCKIAQAGWYNVSDIYISDNMCWGSNWLNKNIYFFEFPYMDKGFIDILPMENI